MIFNIYKEKNWTSFDVVNKVRNILKIKKAGHAGTLDPLAEGVLIVLTEKDTKKQDTFMKLKKEYIADIAFGIKSPTYDLEILPTVVSNDINLNDLKEKVDTILPQFVGEINQIAPPYSAKKVSGKVLYKEARKGNMENIELPSKIVNIFNIEILDFYTREFDTNEGKYAFPVLKIKIECSSGTYIRSIAHDLGEDLSTGGILVNLIRSKVGDYIVENSIKISELKS